jgi:AbrB family looped-hinge helix DNA binding protein
MRQCFMGANSACGWCNYRLVGSHYKAMHLTTKLDLRSVGNEVSYQDTIDRGDVMQSRETAKLSAKFQISIPKAVRAAQHWEAGQEFAFISKGDGVLLVPVPRREELAGMARGADPTGYRDRSDRV